jgi:hypothetical protein
MAADATMTSIMAKPYLVPCSRNHDHSAIKRRTSLELVHQRLGHRKCRGLLAASKHGIWANTVIHMGPEQDCISCNISTICATNRNKESHTGGTYAGEFVFMDILYPTVAIGLTTGTTFPLYLILVDAYSRYACIYWLTDKSSECDIDTLTRYQADHGHIGNYGYVDIA